VRRLGENVFHYTEGMVKGDIKDLGDESSIFTEQYIYSYQVSCPVVTACPLI
jgi:hypothetical protein